MNRQTFFFLLLLIIFFDLPRGGFDGNSEKNNQVLETFRASLKQAREQSRQSEYYLGYGNLTGLLLSYQDHLDHRNISQWPFRSYSIQKPWRETQTDSLLPDEVSSRVKQFWARDPVEAGSKAYMLNISGDADGAFDVVTPKNSLRPLAIELPPYLKDYYNSYRSDRYEEDKQRYEEDPENNMPPSDYPEVSEKIGNITKFSKGNVALRFQSLSSAFPDLNVPQLGLELYHGTSIVHAVVEFSDAKRSDVHELRMYMIYFQDTGSLVGITKSAKFMGNHALPHFTMDSSNFNRSRELMSRLLNVSNLDKDVSLEDVTNAVERAQTSCELVSYIQLKKTDYTKEELVFIDDELRLRQGLPIPKALPKIEVQKALFYSPDCGLMFESNTQLPFVGVRKEVKLSQFRNVLVGMFFLTLMEVYLFIRQVKACRTPSHLSNVSFISIGLLSGYDSIVAMLMLSVMWISDLYLLCACNTVLSILLFYVFELRYLSTINAAQANERDTSWWQILRGSSRSSEQTPRIVTSGGPPADLEAQVDSNSVPTDTAGSNNPQGQNSGTNQNRESSPPTAVANNAPTTPIATQNDVETPTTFGSSNGVSYFALSFVFSSAVTILILNAISWSVGATRMFEYIFLLLLNSYWLPQFLRNTLKNRPKTLRWEFVFGNTFARLVPLTYLTLYRSNPLKHPHDPWLLITVTSWISVQILLLYLQSRLGARFWLNSKWLPEQYNYHPVIRLKDLEVGFSKEIMSSLKVNADQEVSLYENDCAICMSTLTFPVLMGDKHDDKSYEAMMKEVMITPCHHSFHTACLEDWMIYKLQCPVCRSSLPPL